MFLLFYQFFYIFVNMNLYNNYVSLYIINYTNYKEGGLKYCLKGLMVEIFGITQEVDYMFTSF